jgi:hypothetical protein
VSDFSYEFLFEIPFIAYAMLAAVSNLSGNTICLKMRAGNPPERPELFFLRLATHKAQHRAYLHMPATLPKALCPTLKIKPIKS